MEQMLPGFHAALNVHPMFVHFPIALWLTALLLWLLAVTTRRNDLFTAGRWLVYLGALGAAASVATGFIATAKMGHTTPGHDLVHTHRNMMVVAAVLGGLVATGAFIARRRTTATLQRLLLAGLLVTNLVLVGGTDRGALLVFGYGIGTAGLEPPHGGHEHHHGGHDHGAAGADSSTTGHEHGEGHDDHGISEHEHSADLATGKVVGGEAPTPHVHEHETAGSHSHTHSAAADGGSGEGSGLPVPGQVAPTPPAHDHTNREHGDGHPH